jgi:hypothetical protein
VQGGLLDSHVVPVIEPIKLTSTFNGTTRLFSERRQRLALIINPAVGELAKTQSSELIASYISEQVIPSIIMGSNTTMAINALREKTMPSDNLLVIMENRDYLDQYVDLFKDNFPRFTLFPDERQIRRTVRANKVMFSDNFKKRDKNADYQNYEDEFYSDDHLHFSEEGFAGFADYSIVGEEYDEGGFAPYAVAIHIVYFAHDDTMRIRHFVSDSNTDTKDVAGKYYEAVLKLRTWFNDGQARQLTTALSILLSHADSGYYPGLPTIKKLSIMHHMELIGRYLSALDGGVRQ